MAKPPRGSDLVSVLRGLARVGSAAMEVRSEEVTRAWATSSLKPLVMEGATKFQEAMTTAVQQPQTLQKNASKNASEALARISMVTEGLKAYRSTSVQPAQESVDSAENPMYDPAVKELNIEELLMQEASNVSNLDVHDPSSQDPLAKMQEEASDLVDKAKSTKEEVSRRIEEFEPLINIAKGEEKEITYEHLQVIDGKVSELRGIAHGQTIIEHEEAESSRGVEENIIHSVSPSQSQDSVDLSQSQVLSIENMMMLDAMSGHQDQLFSDSQKYLYKEAEGAADAVKKGIEDTKDEISQRISGFEPLLDIAKSEEQEITEEHLDAISEKLSEIHDVSFGHDLKIFREVDNTKPVEEVLQDIMTQQASVYELKTETAKAEGTETAIAEESEEAVKDATGIKTVQQQIKETELANIVPKENTVEAAEKLEDSISQVAKAVTVDDSYSPNGTAEVKGDVQVDPSMQKSQIEKIVSKESVSKGTSSHSTLNSDGSGGANGADISPMASVAAGASFTVVAAAGTAAAATVITPSTSIESPTIHPKPSIAPDKPKPKLLGKKPLAKGKPKSTLSENAQARKVPQSRLGRLVSFGGLAAGLSVGTLAEVTRRSLGLNQGKGSGSLLDASPFLTEANARRIVDTLCRVRGAALKLGQMLSIQDSAIINPQLQKIFERVRQSADFMPSWQLEDAIRNQLGDDWRSKVATFDEHPFAAASIGQVHLATLHDGRSVAMKIQYPGVAEGIESDINNLVSTLKVANIFPEGLFVDNVIEVAKKELRWECDYVREAECTQRFRDLVKPYPEFYVPEVIPELCTPLIFTSELIAGIPVDKCTEIDQDSRNYISEQILRMCLMELFQFGFMQTDPNWSNFFYNAETEQVALLDFGACREYSKDFVDKYINLIHGAAVKDRERVLKYSQELGFLTGYEAKVMVDAHIDAIMILGEAFQEDKPFVFGDQNTTYRIQNLVPVMLSHRMCAPPDESYSLHRKMSGVFLLCTKLNGVVNCYRLFHDVFSNYKYGGTWEDFHAGRL